MGLSIGAVPVKKVSFGGTEVKKISIGTVLIWQAFAASGVDKVGAQTLPLNAWTPITGRVVRAGFPDTVITANGITVPAGTAVTVSCQNTHSSSHSGNAVRIVNATTGEVIATSPPGTTATPTASGSAYTAAVESLILVEGYATNSLGDRHIVAAGAGSYLTVTPA